MVTCKIENIEKEDDKYKVYFKYFEKIRYTKLSESNYLRLNNNNKNLILKKGALVNIIRVIKPRYDGKGIIELYRIGELLKNE